MSITHLKKALGNWDGKATDPLEALARQHSDDPDYCPKLLTWLADSQYQKGASWLLKRHIETLGPLTPRQAGQLYRALDKLKDWQSQLHALQCLAYLPVSKAQAGKVEHFLRSCLTEQNKFVRAWAYSGFHQLAQQHPAYAEESQALLKLAQRDEAPSVKARIRQILKSSAK